MLSVFAHKLALHESNIGPKGKRSVEASTNTSSADAGVTNNTVEIRDLGGLRQLTQRCTWGWQWEMMNKDTERRDTARDWQWFAASSLSHR
jgi:hypothetical protein